MKIHAPSVTHATPETGQHTMGVFLAKQLGVALFRLDFSEASDDIVASLKHGLREASTDCRGLRLDPRLVSTSASAMDSKVSEI
jgi:hypothetical protein